ncbi:MAG: AAA family ATPase, partial [Azoarcus sp.]|nr:AAA family ATPase [Azoarcus sp.]
MTRKKLPIGIQAFAKIREDNYYYVDKTAFALRMIEEGTAYFLSRPRRFGKSLFLSTLAELFAGNERLFRGLYCHDKWDWTVKYPVIRISFAEGVLNGRAALEQCIGELLEENEERFGLQGKPASVPGRFRALIHATERQYGQRVVILVDEYDKPIIDNLTRPDVALEMRDGLRNLYSVIKGQDEHIKFAFLTGVSKFSKVNIFSGLNHLNDITLDAEYSDICGYTEADVDTVFAPELEGLDRDEIRHWYNGYNWNGRAVYNPFDLLLLFQKRVFRPFWFETGTPTFLIDMLTERQVYLPALLKMESSAELLSAFEVGAISTEAMMFQSGYLTLAGEKKRGNNIAFVLTYPNHEVRSALTGRVMGAWIGNPHKAEQSRFALYDALEINDFARIREIFFSLYASVP